MFEKNLLKSSREFKLNTIIMQEIEPVRDAKAVPMHIIFKNVRVLHRIFLWRMSWGSLKRSKRIVGNSNTIQTLYYILYYIICTTFSVQGRGQKPFQTLKGMILELSPFCPWLRFNLIITFNSHSKMDSYVILKAYIFFFFSCFSSNSKLLLK